MKVDARRQHRTDGTGYGGSVTVAARTPVDRAAVDARRAANALERAPEVLSPELLAAAIVHDDDVQLLPFARAMHMRRVHGEALARRTSREHAQEHREFGRAGNHLLHS